MAEDNEIIQQAHNLVKSGQRESARDLVFEALGNFPNNAKLWWLLAQVTTIVDERYWALENVLRLKPDFEKAQKWLDVLDSKWETEQDVRRDRNCLTTFGSVLLIVFVISAVLSVFVLLVTNNEITLPNLPDPSQKTEEESLIGIWQSTSLLGDYKIRYEEDGTCVVYDSIGGSDSGRYLLERENDITYLTLIWHEDGYEQYGPIEPFAERFEIIKIERKILILLRLSSYSDGQEYFFTRFQ